MLDEFISIKSFYEKAKTMLPEDVFAFISSGSLDEKALNILRQELIETMLLAGCSSLNEIHHDTVYVNVKKFGL